MAILCLGDLVQFISCNFVCNSYDLAGCNNPNSVLIEIDNSTGNIHNT